MVVQSESQTLDGSGNPVSSRVASDPFQSADRGLVVVVANPNPQTYSAGITNLSIPANPSDVFTITGSAGKTIRVNRIIASGIATSDANVLLQLIKRSSANSGGTATTLTAVPHDVANGVAAATVRAYTVNPTVGTAVGTLRTGRVAVGSASPSSASPTASKQVELFSVSGRGQAIVLRGATEVLAVNMNAVTLTGGSMSFWIEWTEE